MTSTRTNRGLLCVVAATSGLGCQPPADPPATASETPEPASCETAGPLACTVTAAADRDGACDLLRSCLMNRDWSDGLTVTAFEGCEATSIEFDDSAPDTSRDALALFEVQLQLDGPSSHAAYLFVRTGNGWCPADQPLEPLWLQGGYCEVGAAARWIAASGGAAELTLASERRCRLPIDADEAEAGVSDIGEQECVRSRYTLAAGGVRLLSRNSSAGPCSR